MSDRVSVDIDVNLTESLADIEAIKNAADQQARDWKIKRNTILRQIREGFTMISQLMSAVRQAFTLFGQQIDPFFSALIGMVLSTASMLISSATTLALTGIGGAAAAVIFGLAVGFQILTLGKLIADKVSTMKLFSQMQLDLQELQRRPSGLGGF